MNLLRSSCFLHVASDIIKLRNDKLQCNLWIQWYGGKRLMLIVEAEGMGIKMQD